jgi:hypothetical protein
MRLLNAKPAAPSHVMEAGWDMRTLVRHLLQLRQRRGRVFAWLGQCVAGNHAEMSIARRKEPHKTKLCPMRWFVLGFDPAPMGKRALQKHIDETVSLFLSAYATPQS